MIPNIGPLEIAVVLIVALVIFGPKRLPELGSSLGKSIRGFGKGVKGEEDEVVGRFGCGGHDVVMVGDDAGMDIALGQLGGWRTVLVRTGMTGATAVDRLPHRQRPDVVIDSVDRLAGKT